MTDDDDDDEASDEALYDDDPSKTFVPAQKPILLNANHLFVWHKMFVTATICK